VFHYGYYFTEQNELALTGNLIFVFYIFNGSIQNVLIASGGHALSNQQEVMYLYKRPSIHFPV
jgi:hypothetical protein